ncbi:cytochrome c [Geothrix sp. SG200]|uniref:c-type cytochrome n=1 Tax=Geothrix sp. SG200 TaxID=2922865 RepID=UPI001FAE5478|nr:cytochrome c [Geothrix sp. SG200]
MFSRAVPFLCAATLALPVLAQQPAIKSVPARYTSPASGSEMYLAYCASCHGSKGLGNGPVAAHLHHPVPNLTTLSQRNRDAFPKEQVSRVIRGEPSAETHGLQDMPAWGPVFRSLNSSQEPIVRMRVANLARHIESLQAK